MIAFISSCCLCWRREQSDSLIPKRTFTAQPRSQSWLLVSSLAPLASVFLLGPSVLLSTSKYNATKTTRCISLRPRERDSSVASAVWRRVESCRAYLCACDVIVVLLFVRHFFLCSLPCSPPPSPLEFFRSHPRTTMIFRCTQYAIASAVLALVLARDEQLDPSTHPTKMSVQLRETLCSQQRAMCTASCQDNILENTWCDFRPPHVVEIFLLDPPKHV